MAPTAFEVDTYFPNTSRIRLNKVEKDSCKDDSKCIDKKYADAFLHYSNDETRMNTLKLIELSGNDRNAEEETKHKNRLIQQRKTRISFEIHPILLLEELDDDDQEDSELSDFDFEAPLKQQEAKRASSLTFGNTSLDYDKTVDQVVGRLCGDISLLMG